MTTDGFYERLRVGLGAYVTPEMMSKHRFEPLGSLLATVRGVHVEYNKIGPVVSLRGNKKPTCVPSYFIDGALYYLSLPRFRPNLPPGSSTSDAEALTFGDIAAVAPPSRIKAIEVYPSTGGIPLQYDYTSLTGCGSIVIWTR